MADLYFPPSAVTAPRWSFDYSPSTHHVKTGEFAVPATTWSFDYAPATHLVKGAPSIILEAKVGPPGGLVLLQPATLGLLIPTRYIDPDTFYAHAVFRDLQSITAEFYVDQDIFYPHILVRGYSRLLLTGYVTIEFDGERRKTIRRDVINYELFKDRINFTKVSHTDEIRYSTRTDNIFFSLRA